MQEVKSSEAITAQIVNAKLQELWDSGMDGMDAVLGFHNIMAGQRAGAPSLARLQELSLVDANGNIPESIRLFFKPMPDLFSTQRTTPVIGSLFNSETGVRPFFDPAKASRQILRPIPPR